MTKRLLENISNDKENHCDEYSPSTLAGDCVQFRTTWQMNVNGAYEEAHFVKLEQHFQTFPGASCSKHG